MSTTEEKLQHAQEWMRREVLAQKQQLWKTSRSEDDIIASLKNYFPQEVFLHFSDTDLKELVSSELLFDLQWQHPDIDGSAIVLGYQKVFDSLVEEYITKWFRKYIKKVSSLPSPENTPLEKSLYQVVKRGFRLSAWRIFEILENTKNSKDTWYYESLFISYLQSSKELEISLLTSNFLIHLRVLAYKKILWEKRHSWILSAEDTVLARKIYIWNLQDGDSLLNLLAQLCVVDG